MVWARRLSSAWAAYIAGHMGQFAVTYLGPLVWLLLAGWWLARHPALLRRGVGGPWAIGLFALKCLAGSVFTLVAFKFIPNQGDVWPWFYDSLELYHMLWNNPAAFVQELRSMASIQHAGLADTNSDLVRSAYSGIKLLMLGFNLLSGGNLFTNTILFNAISTWVLLHTVAWWQRTLQHRWLGWAWVAIPSVLLYSSAIIKEGILFTAMSAALPLAHGLATGRSRRWAPLWLLLAIGMLLFFKFLVGALLLAAWYWAWATRRLQVHPLLSAIVAVFFGGLLFFGLGDIWPGANLPQYLVDRQQAFAQLAATSKMAAPQLQPTATSILSQAPLALFNSLMQPLPGVGGKAMYLVYSAEIALLWLGTAWLVFRQWRQRRPLTLLLYMVLGFALANLLFIGYIVPNVGALVRYRSIFLPGVFLPIWYAWAGSRKPVSQSPGASGL